MTEEFGFPGGNGVPRGNGGPGGRVSGGGVPGGGVPGSGVAGSGVPGNGSPAGEVYDWYTRGMALLGHGDANAAVQLLGHAVAAEPASPSVREALGRAQFEAGQYDDAVRTFAWIVDRHPTDDYAQFGLGMAAHRTGNLRVAVEHLALAVAMRPDLAHYGVALRGARAALNRA